MRWSTYLCCCVIAALHVALTWLIVCLIHVADAFSDPINKYVILITILSSCFIAFVVICGLLHAPMQSGGMRVTLVGLFASSIIMMTILFIWMPFYGFSWEVTTLVTGLFALFVLVLACRRSAFKHWTMLYWKKARCIKYYNERQVQTGPVRVQMPPVQGSRNYP